MIGRFMPLGQFLIQLPPSVELINLATGEALRPDRLHHYVTTDELANPARVVLCSPMGGRVWMKEDAPARFMFRLSLDQEVSKSQGLPYCALCQSNHAIAEMADR